jgi:hypothetical protein
MLIEQPEWLFYAVRAAVLVIALLACSWAFCRWRKTGRIDMQHVFSQLDESRNETRTLAGLTQQLMAQLSALESRVEDRRQLAMASGGGAQRGYELALQMARNGATPEAIVSASGVTRQEARLLTQLHNRTNH